MPDDPSSRSEIVDAIPWRASFSLQLARAFLVVFASAAIVMPLTVQGAASRLVLAATATTGAAMCAVAGFAAKPSARTRAWLIVAPTLAGALAGFATVGFVAGPAVVLSLTLLVGGLLLGRPAMLVLSGLAILGLGTIATAMVQGDLPVPAALDVSMREPLAWVRTITVTLLATGLLGEILTGLVGRLEQSRLRAESEALRRIQAEGAGRRTEIRALEARQMEAIGQLAAGIAHDFNNQLTAILGSSHVLRELVDPDAERIELVDEIESAARRAAELTSQLLAYSRKAQMVLVPTDIHELIEASVRLARRTLDPKLVVTTRLEAEQSIVAIDVALMQNALLNLLLNARDAIPDRGEVHISTRNAEADVAASGVFPRGRTIEIEIRDDGGGIEPDALPHIFDPFYTTKAVGKGTGLGLAAVSGTVKAHRGSITVTSELGVGTAFRMVLPVSEADAVGTTRSAAARVRGSGWILVVDDEPSVRAAAVATLRSLGYDVAAASDGASAIEMVRDQPDHFVLVLLDLRMPGLGGEATFDALRAIAPGLRVLVWSGYAADHDVDGMLGRGAVGFVQKPYTVAEFSRTVAAAIRSDAGDPRSIA